MEYFWAVLILICLIASFIGLIMLFIRGLRRKGALLLFGGFFASIFMSFSIDLEEGAIGAQSATDTPDGLEGFPVMPKPRNAPQHLIFRAMLLSSFLRMKIQLAAIAITRPKRME